MPNFNPYNKIMKKILLFICLIFISINCFSQAVEDTVFNQIDNNGWKQGFWKNNITNLDKTVHFHSFEHYLNNRRDGLCIYYYENGNIQSKTFFKDDIINGSHTVFRESGLLQYEENYYYGRLHGVKKYYDVDGRLSAIQYYKDGLKHGEYQKFSPKGNLIIRSAYSNGLENASRKVYSDDEKHELLNEYIYQNGILITTRVYVEGVLFSEVHQASDSEENTTESKPKHLDPMERDRILNIIKSVNKK